MQLQGRDLAAGITFAILLNFKHLFLSVSLVYFVYLLRHYCFSLPIQPLKIDDNDPHVVLSSLKYKTSDGEVFYFKHFLLLGFAVVGIFAVSFGPFLFAGGIEQLTFIKERLFPFGRGLCHAYWAPNLWAIYAGLDRVLNAILPKEMSISVSLTRGLVGDKSANFAVLPSPSPLFVLLICIFTLVVDFLVKNLFI